MSRFTSAAIRLLLGFMLVISSASAQEPSEEKRVINALRLDVNQRITLDGSLDEEVWQSAAPATDFLQQAPDIGNTATERTEVRILYSQTSLYMGVICFDSEPDKLLGFQRRRDETLGADDRFMWT